MKTIFDWLCHPDFRTKPGMFIGHGDLNTLEAWMVGYEQGCIDAGHPECCNTPNGVSIDLLRDFISLSEKDRSTGGIAFILLSATGGNEEKAWEQFFIYFDAFMKLTISESESLKSPNLTWPQFDKTVDFTKT